MPKMHPVAQDLLFVILRSVIKAGAAASDSLLEDFEGVADEATRRVRKGRKRLRKIARPRVVDAEPEEED
jgi:hypothetical protein